MPCIQEVLITISLKAWGKLAWYGVVLTVFMLSVLG